MSWLQKHADEILAAITSILAAGHLAHLFSQEWLVLLSALVTLAATFIPQAPVVTLPAPQQQPPQPVQPPPLRPGGPQK